MTIRVLSLLAGSCALLAQDAQPSNTKSTSPPAEPSSRSTPTSPVRAGVRRFSAGGVLSFSAFQLMETRSVTDQNITYNTKPSGPRVSGGGLVQWAFADRFALAGQALLRRTKFETNTDTTVSNGTIKQQDFSSADFWEFPVTLRRYSRPHASAGARWFAEGGVAWRRTRNIRSSLQTTDAANKTVCCDEHPIPPQSRLAAGVTVGGGYQLVDQFGVRLVPLIRYTRWLQPTFDRQSIQSRRDQLEAGLAITF